MCVSCDDDVYLNKLWRGVPQNTSFDDDINFNKRQQGESQNEYSLYVSIKRYKYKKKLMIRKKWPNDNEAESWLTTCHNDAVSHCTTVHSKPTKRGEISR